VRFVFHSGLAAKEPARDGLLSDHFNASEVAIRLVLSIGVGLLVGFEREWSRKGLGVRIFAITALLGTLSALVAEFFALGAMAAVALLIIFVNGRAA
jgi:hypothetical protein